MNNQMFCEAFEKLNALAMKSVVDKNLTDEGRKHRRAVMDHPKHCNHPVCVATYNLMKQCGMDQIDFTGLAEQTTKEKLK